MILTPRKLLRASAVAACTAAAAGLVPTAAQAANWTELPASQTSDVSTAAWPLRLPNGDLALAYPALGGTPNTEQMVLATANAAGKLTGGSGVTGNWASLNNPSVNLTSDGLRMFWGGIQDPTSDNPVPGLEFSTAPGPFGPWTRYTGGVDVASCGPNDVICPPGYLAELYSYAARLTSVTLGDGLPLEAWQAGSIGVFAHRGTSPARDTDGGATDDTGPGTQEASEDGGAKSGQNFQDQPGSITGCCGYDPQLALDARSGQPTIAWYSNASGYVGVFVQDVDPSHGNPIDTPVRMPGSESNSAGGPRGRTPLTNRPGYFGTYTALQTGPHMGDVTAWAAPYRANGTLFAGGKPIVVSHGTREVRNVNITADPQGRLWVVWTRDTINGLKVYASRSDATATHFGAPVEVNPPPGTGDSFAIDASAQSDKLDVIGTFGPAPQGVEAAIWSTQVAPGQSVVANRVSVKRGHKATITIHVADAGHALRGATVAVVGHRKHRGKTNGKGVVHLRLGPFKHSATIKIQVTDRGYATTTIKVRIHVHR